LEETSVTIPEDETLSGRDSKLSSRRDFEEVLRITTRFVESRALWWKLSARAIISPRLDEQAVSKDLGPKDSETRKIFEKILSREIIPALNKAADSLPVFSRQLELVELDEEDKEEFSERTKLVAEALLSNSLRQRLLIRKTCKGPTLEELRWDISIKKHDLGTGSVPDIPYATLEIVLIPDVGDLNPFSILGLGAARQVFVFDCHLDDLEEILRDLSNLRDNLSKLELGEMPAH